MTTAKKLIGRLHRFEEVARALQNGLLGDPFNWPEWARKLYVPVAGELGCTLLTITALHRQGYELKPKALPVGKVYYGAPLKRYAPVYIAEVQATKRQDGK